MANKIFLIVFLKILQRFYKPWGWNNLKYDNEWKKMTKNASFVKKC